MSDNTPKYKIIYDREGCIGAAACAAANADHWEIVEDGKADLKGAKETSPHIWERTITESELQRNLEAAESCPVRVIKIIEIASGKQIYP